MELIIGGSTKEPLKKWFERLKQMNGLTWRKIVWWPHIDLCRLGIDTINLLCAWGLPGAEKMDIDYCLDKIEQWAQKVKLYTAQMMHHYERHPEQYGHSLGYFKALCLITALQRDCGVRYNPAKQDPDAPFEAADSFIFGIIQSDGGTCASLPVLYCAVGYHLNYPMFFTHAKGHNLVRWDDGEVRFNIEASGVGMSTPLDEHYRTGRFHITPEIEKAGCILRPNNMRHCLARFLAERSHYWMDHKDYKEAIETMGWAAALHPENQFYLDTATSYFNQWKRYWNERRPPEFPMIFVTCVEKHRFAPTVPLQFEANLCALETMECLLKDKELDRNLWDPLRRGEKPGRVPVEVESEVDGEGNKSITFLFEKQPFRDLGDFANV